MTRSSYATTSTRSLVVGPGVWPRSATNRVVGCALLLVVLLLPRSAHAKLPAGTGITASKTAAGHLTSTSKWTVAKSADPTTQAVDVGDSATVHWTITTTKSASGTVGAYLDGQVCVTNTGSRATQGLAIHDQVMRSSSTTVLNTVAVDVSAKPELNPGEAHCYPYTITLPAASIVSGAIYKDTAHVTITNQSCCPGVPTGPSPSATAALPTSATAIDASITVTDTNGQSFGFSSGGSQSYDQHFDCPGTVGTHTLDDTATIQSTGQTASAEATVACHVYPQSNALERPILDELNAFADNCVSFFLDTQEGQSCDFPCIGESKDHHQGLARTQELSDGSIYFFLSHSEVSESDDRGDVMVFRYGGTVDDERVTGAGVTAPLDPTNQSFALPDEQHPSDIAFLADVDEYGAACTDATACNDSGYLFVTKEFGLDADCEDCTPQDTSTCGSCKSHKVTVYYWEPGSYLQPLGDIVTDLTKPSHVLIDKHANGYYYLIILDNTFGAARPYRAHYTDLFPTTGKGSLNLAAFQPLPAFSFTGSLGSQAKLIRDGLGNWFVFAYDSPDTDGNGDDFVHYRSITFGDAGDVVTLSDELGAPVHIIFPPGETSFTSTGTHYVDHNGRLLLSTSERWSHDRGDPFGYETRVDECAPAQ